MAGSSNFKIFDTTQNNMLSDVAYAASSQIASGYSAGIAPSNVMNKALYQPTVMAYAMGQLLANNNFNVSDSDPAGLITALTNLLIKPNPLLAKFHGSSNPSTFTSTGFTMANVLEPDTTNAFNIIATSIVFSSSTPGLNGPDTGTFGANQFWYPYAVSDGGTGNSHNGIMLSRTNSVVSGTPSHSNFNYVYYRQMPWYILTDGSGNIYPVIVNDGLVEFTGFQFSSHNSGYAGYPFTSPFEVAANLQNTTFTTQSLAALLPPICTKAKMASLMTWTGNGMMGALRTTGSSNTVGVNIGVATSGQVVNPNPDFDMYTNSSQQVDYILSGAAQGNAHLDLYIRGGYVTAAM